MIAGVPKAKYRKPSQTARFKEQEEEQKQEQEQETVGLQQVPDVDNSQKPTVLPRRLYRQNELSRIVASLLAQASILVVGAEGSGKTTLVLAVMEELIKGKFNFAFIEPASTKQMLLEIAVQLQIDTSTVEGKKYTSDGLKDEIMRNLAKNVAILIIDDCHKCSCTFRIWLKQLRALKIPMLVLATNPPKTDIFLNIPRMELQPLPDYAIREVMEQAALERGINITTSELARLQERAGGNPMLAWRTIEEEFIGIIFEGADHNQYVDMTPFILIAGVFFMILRFVGMGTNNHALYIFSGIGAVLFMGFSRLLYNLPKEGRKIE